MQKPTSVATFRKIPLTLILGAMCLVAMPQNASAQTAVPPAPVPEQITAAKSVFIANGGVDANLLGIMKTLGGRDEAYNQFYAGMKTWGRYGPAASPEEADLVFEIRYTYLPGPAAGELDLTIQDSKTHFTLWRVTEFVQPAARQATWKKHFAAAISALIGDVKNIAPAPPPATN
jgi:hypothetical protein